MARGPFIPSGDFESDASKGQRYFLYRACGVKTTPEFLLPRQFAEATGRKWLSKGEAEGMIANIGKLSEPNVEAVKEVREKLLQICMPGADTKAPKSIRNERFVQVYQEAKQAGNDAMNACTDVGPDAFVWTKIGPGNGAFAEWLLEQQYAQKNPVYGGVAVMDRGPLHKYRAYHETFASVIGNADVCKIAEVQQLELPALAS